jgi:hypothetical protein
VARLYTQLLARAQGFTGGPTVVYTVPAGFEAVVRCLTIVVGANVGAQDAFIALHAGPKIKWVFVQGVSNIQTFIQNGRWSFLPGDEIVFGTDGGLTADFYMTGWVLAIP